MTRARHQRVLPRRRRRIPAISRGDLFVVRHEVVDAPQVRADARKDDDVAFAHLRGFPNVSGPPQRSLASGGIVQSDLGGQSDDHARDVGGLESLRGVLRVFLREDEVLVVPRITDLFERGHGNGLAVGGIEGGRRRDLEPLHIGLEKPQQRGHQRRGRRQRRHRGEQLQELATFHEVRRRCTHCSTSIMTRIAFPRFRYFAGYWYTNVQT